MKTKLYFANTYHMCVKGMACVGDEQQVGMFLIDTGSSFNILNKKYFSVDDQLISASASVSAFGNETHEGGIVPAGVVLERVQFKDDFCLLDLDNEFFNSEALRVIGVLGIQFLVNYTVILDYPKKSFTIPIAKEEMFNDEEYKYRVPWEAGLQDYGYPTINISNESGSSFIPTMLDTGSNNNIICKSAVKEHSLDCKLKDIETEINDINQAMSMSMCDIKHKLGAVDKDGNPVSLDILNDYCLWTSRSYFVKGENVPPIAALIGNIFLLNFECVINCGTGSLYSKKWNEDKLHSVYDL